MPTKVLYSRDLGECLAHRLCLLLTIILINFYSCHEVSVFVGSLRLSINLTFLGTASTSRCWEQPLWAVAHQASSACYEILRCDPTTKRCDGTKDRICPTT